MSAECPGGREWRGGSQEGPLFSFFKTKSKVQGLVAVAFDAVGFSLAYMLRDSEGRPVLDFCEYVPCEGGAEMRGALASAVREHGLAGQPCVCIPRPEAYCLRQVNAPAVESTELRDAARWSIKDLIDFEVEEAIIDVFQVPEARLPGRGRRVYVVAGRRALIQQHADLVNASGLRLKVIDIIELALRNLTSLLPQDKRGVALLYLTPGFGLLTVTREGSLYLARNVEADLEQLEYAPRADPADRKPDRSEEIEILMNGLLLESHRSLDYYEHQLGQDPVSSLVIAPMERPIPALAKYLRTNLSIEVRELDLSQVLECKQALSETLQVRCLPAIAGALRAEIPQE